MATREELQEERQRLVEERDAIIARRALVADKTTYKATRLAMIQDAINGANGREPILPRRAKHPGNLAMYDKLQLVKQQIEAEPRTGGLFDEELARIDTRKTETDTRIAAIDDELFGRITR